MPSDYNACPMLTMPAAANQLRATNDKPVQTTLSTSACCSDGWLTSRIGCGCIACNAQAALTASGVMTLDLACMAKRFAVPITSENCSAGPRHRCCMWMQRCCAKKASCTQPERLLESGAATHRSLSASGNPRLMRQNRLPPWKRGALSRKHRHRCSRKANNGKMSFLVKICQCASLLRMYNNNPQRYPSDNIGSARNEAVCLTWQPLRRRQLLFDLPP